MASFGDLVSARFRSDLDAWERHGWGKQRRGRLGAVLMLLRYPGVRATLIYRLGHWASMSRIPGGATLAHGLNVAFHGIELQPSVPIGPGLYLPHSVGTVITAERIGANVTIQGGITIGTHDERHFPTIEDDVLLGAGCRIIGAVTVGWGAKVGANAVVVKDVPAHATAVGVPARIVGQESELPSRISAAK